MAGWRLRLERGAGVAPWLPWIRERGSLTARLESCGRFRVCLLAQGLARPTRDEAPLLGIPPRALAWVREVALLCDDRPLVFAHTVLPRRPRGPLTRWFARLGTRSLGRLLFADPGFARGLMQARRIDARHLLHAPAARVFADGPGPFWARRSRFSYRNQAVLVSEVFAPAVAALRPRGRTPGDG